MTATVAVIVFPGSNCEHDVCGVLSCLGAKAELVWHSASSLGDVDAVVIPGGFAHGDYLRPGAIARFSPIMDDVVRFAQDGGAVVGICNGFQVLTEAGLLPGALMRNEGLRFICDVVECEISSSNSVLTSSLEIGTRLRLPINHYQGNYVCPAAALDAVESNGQVVMRYVQNPNGSLHSIAALANRSGNVVGLMPHPERASSALLGSSDGVALFQSLLDAASS